MRAKLLKKFKIADGTLYLEFGTSGEEIHFFPGQFFRLTLINPIYSDERGNSRFLGFVNSPSQKGIVASVTRMGPSAFKRSLLELPTGEEAEIDGVDGKITLPDDPNKVIVIVTGGIGIAPVMSLLRWIKEKSLGYKVTLLYSNTNRERALFMDELNGYVGEDLSFKLVATMTQDGEWNGEKRRIDAQFLKDHLELNNENKYFITGTPRFVPAMVKHLQTLGVNPSQMKFEIFTGY